MRKKIFLFVIFAVSLSNISYTQWFVLSTYQYVYFTSVDFINANTGWAVSGLTIWKSTNGGVNWVEQSYYPTGVYNRKIQFVDLNTGWCIGQSGAIQRTTNGGTNWILQVHPDSIQFTGLSFVNSQTGWVVGWREVIKSTNGGINWTTLIQDYNEYLSVFFVNTMTGWVSSELGTVLKTTNGGQNWILQNTGYQHDVYALFFVSENTGWMADEYGYIVKTTNGGTNWVTSSTGFSYGIAQIKFINPQTGWAVGGYSSIIKTTNGGLNWGLQYIGAYDDVLYSIDFVSPDTGYAVGDEIMLKTTNSGGYIGITRESENIPSSFSLSQNYPNPFNPTTKIKFDVPLSKGGLRGLSDVIISLKIYDLLGREVATLVNEQLKPGSYEVVWDGSNYASGIYFYRLEAGEYVETKKMVLIK